ncbi:probable G-protein coupled receptor 139 [Lineus longissimus]|uniref:probable G-protein coupled receptor 139 n=1 Tax=Lineus longissimus TaxID=88925 RepID=UPI00315E0113
MDSCADLLNVTVEEELPANMSSLNKNMYVAIHHWFYKFGLPTICMCGFLGNVMNLMILTGKRIQRALRMTERSANNGLVALAVSDLMFCLLAFPTTFLPEDQQFPDKGFFLYYGIYCAALINIFIMSSTWLTVVMATERYLAICHPLKSRKILTMHRSKVAIVMVFVLSVVVNIPVFWRYSFREEFCDNSTHYTAVMLELFGSNSLDHAYRTVWATLGNFIPLILLVFFNFCLIRQIHKSYAERRKYAKGSFRGHHETETNNRVTVTLISIVVMFLVLVAPSEVVKHIAKLANENIEENYTYKTLEVITNVMQTVNFSANFILYCCINPSFRRTMKHMFCAHCEKRTRENEFSRYETCLSTTPESIRKKICPAQPIVSTVETEIPNNSKAVCLQQENPLLEEARQETVNV